MVKNFVRALRASFLIASILPFIFGSFIIRDNFNLIGFILGLFAVVFTHLSANLINDYADSRSGVDYGDKHFYPFFGGSKLIEKNVFSEKAYLNAAIFCAVLAWLSVILLAFALKSTLVIPVYLLIIILSWQYSAKPLRFSYHYLGEILIFFLFGPVLVMGGYFIQNGMFPDLRSFILSLPSGVFTAALLFANEVPDFSDDQRANKNNWVRLSGLSKAYLIYVGLISLCLSFVILGVFLKYIGVFSLASLLLVIPTFKAARILKDNNFSKIKLLGSSGITINMQALLSIILILGLIL
jgi:1,4-dihydroxy-2-naphthoate octaprenyltransferase